MVDLPSQPVKDTETSFSLFNWLRKIWLWLKPVSEAISVDETQDPPALTVYNDITFSGTGLRILGDFSSATQADRLLFQTSIVNGGTNVGVIPNGTSTAAAYTAFGSSDASNAQAVQIIVLASNDIRLMSTKTGSASYGPLALWTNNTKQLEIDTAGKATFTNDAYVGSNVIYHAGNFTGAKLKSVEYKTSTSGTWTWPTGVDLCWVTLIGGGGGGAGARYGTALGSQGGGGAGETLWRVPYARGSQTQTAYGVGSPGAGGAGSSTSAGNNGNAGGDTTWGNFELVAKGGGGGEYAVTSAKGGTGGGRAQATPLSNTDGAAAVLGGLYNLTGGNGGGASNSASGKIGGGSEWHIGGTGGSGSGSGGGGGASSLSDGGLGRAAGAGTPATPSTPGNGAGGGGGGSSTTAAATGGSGGNGGDGYLLIEWIG